MRREPAQPTYERAGVEDAAEVCDFLAEAMPRSARRDDERMRRALAASYVSVVMRADGGRGAIVGFARAVSDGAFVAALADLALAEPYAAYAPALLERIAAEIKREGISRGAKPTSIAAFPAGTAERTIFWRAGFRVDMQHTVMRYVGGASDGEVEGARGCALALPPRRVPRRRSSAHEW